MVCTRHIKMDISFYLFYFLNSLTCSCLIPFTLSYSCTKYVYIILYKNLERVFLLYIKKQKKFRSLSTSIISRRIKMR